MAYVNARVQSLGATTTPRPASLIHGHRFVSRNAVRTRLACGCLTHKHTCQKHAVTTANAGPQGSTSAGALSTACPSSPQSCRGVNGRLFASATRPSGRSASVSSLSPLSLPVLSPGSGFALSTKLYNSRSAECADPDRYSLQHTFLAHRNIARRHLTGSTLHKQRQAFEAIFNPMHFLQVQVVRAQTAQGEVEETASGSLLPLLMLPSQGSESCKHQAPWACLPASPHLT